MPTSHSVPVGPLGLAPSFGFGDRTGLATPGHVAAMRRSGNGIAPIFPQQSIREMQRTRRTADQVMHDALAGAAQAGWTERVGADADHLKTTADIDITFRAGFCFFTLDPSDLVDPQADDYRDEELAPRTLALGDDGAWIEPYVGRTIILPNDTRLSLTSTACQRAAIKYGRALYRKTRELAQHLADIHRGTDRPYEIELSVDETPQPTTLAEHYLIADQCRLHNVPLISLAPRFPGDFEKGIDFIGDPQFSRSLADHAAIAELLGPYKLSLHSGSDKLSMYAEFARATRGRFHVKTAGTSYLEALRVVARHDEGLFRAIIRFSRDRFETDRATYHISARLGDAPCPDDHVSLGTLEEEYLERWNRVPPGRGFTRPGRQILHCTFGSVLTHAAWGPQVLELLRAHPQTYAEVLEDHFSRHLEALQQGLSAST